MWLSCVLCYYYFLLFWWWSGSKSVLQYHFNHCTSKDSNKICVNKHVKLYQLVVTYSPRICIWNLGEICVKKHVKLYRFSLRICMWNLCEEACEILLQISMNLHVKQHVKRRWKCMWKGWHHFTPFSHMFHYVIFHTHVKYECEIHVKSSEKHVKQMWKPHIIYTFFHMIFFNRLTPSNLQRWFRILGKYLVYPLS